MGGVTHANASHLRSVAILYFPSYVLIAYKSALALSVIRQQNFRILRRFFRTTLTPAIRRYTCHALMRADVFPDILSVNYAQFP